MNGTNHIAEWAAYCAAFRVSFETFSRGIDEFMADPTWIDAGWPRLLYGVENAEAT